MTQDTILPITLLGQDEILRSPTKEVERSSDMSTFAQQMRRSMHTYDGIGIAAPQVGESIRMFVIDTKLFPPEIQKLIQTDTFINPKITKKSFKREITEEGCLSIPGVFGEVPRAIRITLEAYDINWKKMTIPAKDLLARVFQHEIDHLNGTLFIDHSKKKTLHKIEGENIRPWDVSEVESK